LKEESQSRYPSGNTPETMSKSILLTALILAALVAPRLTAQVEVSGPSDDPAAAQPSSGQQPDAQLSDYDKEQLQQLADEKAALSARQMELLQQVGSLPPEVKSRIFQEKNARHQQDYVARHQDIANNLSPVEMKRHENERLAADNAALEQMIAENK
jgi:hypothetical protein